VRRGRARMRALRPLSGVLLAAAIGLGSAAAKADAIRVGDAAWHRRAQGEREGQPLQTPILAAIAAYERALDARPESLEARWKLLRALHFAGDFASEQADARRVVFERARNVAETGLDLVAERAAAGTRLEELDPEQLRPLLGAADLPASDVAQLYFWSAINWAAWSRPVGLLTAVQQGVANRLHGYASVAIALEPEVEDGGALRLLGRLHSVLPRVPFVSGWVDRNRAIPLVERAYAIAPAHPGNQLLLALTLLELDPERRGEALDLLQEVAGLDPRPATLIEDLAIRREARERLATDLAGETT